MPLILAVTEAFFGGALEDKIIKTVLLPFLGSMFAGLSSPAPFLNKGWQSSQFRLSIIS